MTKWLIDQLIVWELLKDTYYGVKVLRTNMTLILIDQLLMWEVLKVLY